MIVVKHTDLLEGKELVATIGFFDGVHQGHRFLIHEMKEIARQKNLPSAVITFPKHPRAVLQTDYQPKLLNSFEEKIEHLATTGVDYCIVIDFTTELSQMTAQSFLSTVLAEQFHIKTLVVGYDHRFGHERVDGFEQYIEYGRACGVEVIKATPYNGGKTVVSSSEIRRELMLCHVEKAAELLTYSYQLRGHVIRGHEIGRTLGFPTANIQIDEPFKVLPGVGVYAVWVDVEGERYKGMLYIGDRPTLDNGENISLEVNILDFSETIYNIELTVSFIYYVRGDIKFDSLEQLKEQLTNDRKTVNKLLVGS